jgi:hypothetical protein
MFVKSFDSLIGIDSLWSIAVECQNERSRVDTMELLVDLYLKQTDTLREAASSQSPSIEMV